MEMAEAAEMEHNEADIAASVEQDRKARFVTIVKDIVDSGKGRMPLARVKRLAKEHSCFGCSNLSSNVPLYLGLATEIFIAEITLLAYAHARLHKRRILQHSDLRRSLAKKMAFAFLRDLLVSAIRKVYAPTKDIPLMRVHVLHVFRRKSSLLTGLLCYLRGP